MKNILIIIALLTLTIACKQVDQSATKGADTSTNMVIEKEEVTSRMSTEWILGTWLNIDNKEVDFILNLNVDQDYVVGEYCSKAKNFFFEDCSLEDEGAYCSVRGPMNSLNIEIEMESCINGALAKGEIQRQDSLIVLTLIKSAGEYGKEHLVPKKVTLKKISDEPFL